VATLPRRDLLRLSLAGLAVAMARPIAACGAPLVSPGGADSGGDAVSPPPADAGLEASPIDAAPPTDGARPGDANAADASSPDSADAADAATDAADAADAAPTPLKSNIANLGPLEPPDANNLRLPPGFTSRVVATTGQLPVATSTYRWHVAPDGGAVYAAPGGEWVYVSNSEASPGGVGALRFNAAGDVVDAYPILTGTSTNCAGGHTPWGTWLSCEEHGRGRVFECDPMGVGAAEARPALGVFRHEAASVDPVRGQLYLSEDEPDGRFYRFTPAAMGMGGALDLTAGTLEVARVVAGAVTWLPVPDPELTGPTATRHQVPASTVFNGGEGLWYHAGKVYLATKGDDRVWEYDIVASTIREHYNHLTAANPILRAVDNLTGSAGGDILVAEDGDDLQIVAILPDGSLKAIVQVVNHPGSEVTGPAFDPSGTRLYFSSQRAPGGAVTFEVTGPFHV